MCYDVLSHLILRETYCAIHSYNVSIDSKMQYFPWFILSNVNLKFNVYIGFILDYLLILVQGRDIHSRLDYTSLIL